MKNVSQVYGAGIRTHDLQHMTITSRPKVVDFVCGVSNPKALQLADHF